MGSNWGKVNLDTVKERARKGIPDSLRGRFWPLFCGATEMMNDEKNKGVYQSLVSQRADTTTEVQLRKDITRTFPKHVQFKNVSNVTKGSGNGKEENGEQYSTGQMSLFRVLKAFALRHPQIGYCQGMGSPCGSFLMYMTEEQAFWMTERFLMSDRYCHFGNMYTEGFPLLYTFFFIYERLLLKYVPKLAQHFQDHDAMTSTYAWRWFQLLFSEFPRETVLVIWDIFFCEGIKILFRVAMGLLQIKERHLLKCSGMELLEVLRDLPNDPEVADSHLVISTALKVNIITRDINKLMEEFNAKSPTHTAPLVLPSSP